MKKKSSSSADRILLSSVFLSIGVVLGMGATLLGLVRELAMLAGLK